MTVAQEQAEELEDLDPTLLERLPEDVQEQIQTGVLDKLPEDVVSSLPPRFQDDIPADLIAAAGSNPTLTAILVIAGVLGIMGFCYGVAKSAFKAAAFFGIVAAIAWFWFANR